MGVRSESYLLFAIELNIHDYFEWCDENDCSPHEFPWCGKGANDTFGILYDGMGGEYALAGYCIKCTGEYDGFPLINLEEERQNCNANKLNEQLITWLEKNNLDRFVKIGSVPNLMLVTHYH